MNYIAVIVVISEPVSSLSARLNREPSSRPNYKRLGKQSKPKANRASRVVEQNTPSPLFDNGLGHQWT
jgi:hypothetical protein